MRRPQTIAPPTLTERLADDPIQKRLTARDPLRNGKFISARI